MSLAFSVLGSGSGGNCTVVICHDESQQRRSCFLIDCGLSPRQVNKRLTPLGLTVHDITAIVVTHFDTDHFYSGWCKIIAARHLRVHIHKRHRNPAWRCGLTARHAFHFEDEFTLDDGVKARSTLLSHDDVGTVGYVFEHDAHRLGFATDLGHVPRALFDLFSLDGGIDALALESNYDRDMQLRSGRPPSLKRRIMGGNGHLSNVQSLQAVREIAGQCGLSHIALLHLSRQCNCPNLLRRLYESDAPHLIDRVTITNQFQATPVLTVGKHGHSPDAVQVQPTVEVHPMHDLPLFANCIF